MEIESLRAKVHAAETLAERRRVEAEAALGEARAAADALRVELQAATDGAARAAAEGAALRAAAAEKEAAHAAITLALQQEAGALRAKVGTARTSPCCAAWFGGWGGIFRRRRS